MKANIADLAQQYLKLIENNYVRPLRLMEVCGTHTVAIFRSGIRQLLPDWIELVSGPGCPVCVTPNEFLDTAMAYAKSPDVIIATFGDMLKIPGSSSSLAQIQGEGGNVQVVYSPMDALKLAIEHPTKKIIFLAVGFETTIPTIAATILMAKQQAITNLYVLTANKLTPPAIQALLDDNQVHVDGFLLPGHVCAILGSTPFEFISNEYNRPAVIAGFEAVDILESIWMLTKQVQEHRSCIENQYRRVVNPAGNITAIQIMQQVFEKDTTKWRGLGEIPSSGMSLRPEYAQYDARTLPLHEVVSTEPKGCRCGEVLRGVVPPQDCPLFAKVCTPQNPIGSCMVSIEGTCAAWYKYGRQSFVFE